jgi:hypothetical protein
MNDDKIASALGLRPLSEIQEDEEQNLPVVKPAEVSHELAVVSVEDDENLKDIETVRQNISNVIDIGEEAMKEMLEIAKQSEQPRAFEVVSTLMKTLLDANKDFADISSKKKYAKEELLGPKQAAQTNVTNNNLIVSTADLLKMLKGDSNG